MKIFCFCRVRIEEMKLLLRALYAIATIAAVALLNKDRPRIKLDTQSSLFGTPT